MFGIIGKHHFTVNEKERGGTSVWINTDIYDNGDKENNIFLNTTITLNSYGNGASISLCGSPLTPDILRKLANELDKAIATAQVKGGF